jgi:hypothetical protein
VNVAMNLRVPKKHSRTTISFPRILHSGGMGLDKREQNSSLLLNKIMLWIVFLIIICSISL